MEVLQGISGTLKPMRAGEKTEIQTLFKSLCSNYNKFNVSPRATFLELVSSRNLAHEDFAKPQGLRDASSRNLARGLCKGQELYLAMPHTGRGPQGLRLAPCTAQRRDARPQGLVVVANHWV